jgi:hypothetical protein
MVTGRLPFNPEGPTHFLVMQELMRLQRSESFVEPRALRPDLPEAAQILLLNALSFDSGRRPQNARIFAEDLAQALIGKINASDPRATVALPSPASGAGGPPAPDAAPAMRIDTSKNPRPAPATDANAAAQTSAPNSPQSVTAPIKDGRENSAKPKSRSLPIIAGLAIAIAIAATAGFVVVPRLSAWLNPKVTPSPTPPPASPEAVRMFNYWLMVRKNPKLYPDGGPSQLPAEIPFAVGDQIHISFISPQRGHLYIINESPAVTGQASSYNILFPTPTANQGLSQISAGKTITIPEHNDGFVFDEEQGVEKIWLIWAEGEVAELEPLKRWANPKDVGEIKDAVQIEALRAFLTTRSGVEPQVRRDEASKQTMVQMKGDVLVKLVNLQHY